MRGLLLVVLSAAITMPPQTRPLPQADSLKLDVPAIFDVLWFESLLTHFTGVGSAASVLRHYTYTEYDTVSLISTRTTYRLGPYHAIGTQNKRVWFQEFVEELRSRDVERQDRDRMTLQDKIHRAIKGTVDAVENRDLSSGFEIQVLRREVMGGRDCLLLTMKPNPRYRARTELGDLARRFDLRVWTDEETHDLIRIEAQLLAPVYLDLVFPERAAFMIQRSPESLPVRTEVTIPRFGRMAVDYSEFKRFATDVLLRFGETVEK